MNKDLKVSSIQLKAFIVSTVIGVGVLSLPNRLAISLGKDGWIAIIATGILVIPIFLIIHQIIIDNSGEDYFQIGRKNLGSPIFTICLLIFLVYLTISTSFIVRNLGELVKAFLLPTTPIEIIILTFILSISYIAIFDIDVILRAGYFVYPIIIVFVVLFILIAIPRAQLDNILPVFQSNPKKIPLGLKDSLASFAGVEMILFALPYVEDKEKIVKSGIIGIVTVTLMYLSLFFMTMTQFSIEQIRRQSFPVLMVAKLVDLPGYFLQNLDNIFMALWIIVVFASAAPAYFGIGKIMKNIFKTDSHKYFIWIFIPVLYKLSLMPENIVQLNETLGKYLEIFGLFSIIIIPLAIFSVGIIRRRIGR